MIKPLIAFLLAPFLAAQTTGILIEHQVRGPVLAAPALYACVPPGTTPGPCVFQPVARIEGAVLGTDLVLRIAPPPVVVNIEPPPLVFAVRQPDGSWVATNPRLIAGATVEVKRNGLENYSAGPAPDFAIVIATGRAVITPKQPWGTDNTIAVRIW